MDMKIHMWFTERDPTPEELKDGISILDVEVGDDVYALRLDNKKLKLEKLDREKVKLWKKMTEKASLTPPIGE